ncbi:MAG: glycosyltransferase [Betaproteobacteria bacterium]|nr:glycosyltransferase [Betaproteobacteria bacterium]
MNILMISDVYFPRVNGVSTSILTFRDELEAMGHRVTLIAPDYGAPAVRVPVREDWVMRIPSRRVPFDPEDRLMRWNVLMGLEGELARAAFDLVHIQTPFVAHYAGLRLARLLGVPCLESYHTFFEEYLYCYIRFAPKPLMRLLARTFSRSQCNRVDALISPSRAMRDELLAYGVRTPIHVIPTGIRRESAVRGDGVRFRARHGIGAGTPVMVYVGRVAFEKNIAFLLEVLSTVKKQVPDALLVIAGEGPARASLEAHARALGLAQDVRFVGYLDRRAELPHCYRAGNVFVFASRTETQGLVLLEAMALGVPVVSLAVMGTKDVLREGEGVLIAEDDVTDFAGKVERLLRDPVLRQSMGERAVAYAEEWSAASMAGQLARCYGALSAPKRRRIGGMSAVPGGEERE